MKKLSFYAIFLAISFLIIEAGIRIFIWFHPIPMLFDSGYNRFRGTPHASIYGYPLNSEGFRDEEFGPKDKHTYRIVGLGDSFTFGVTPYPQNFLTIAEKIINENAPGRKTEIYNMGIPSIGPREELALLTDEALYWDPDLVMINFFVGNDFFESMRSDKAKFIERYSYTATLLYRIYRMLTKTSRDFKTQYKEGWTTYCDTCKTFSPEGYLELQVNRSYIFNTRDPLFESHLADALYFLGKADKICRSRNTRLLVCIFPDESQVNPELQRSVIRQLTASGIDPDWDNSRPNRRLSEELAKMGIPHIDLLPLFEGEKDSACYVPRDTHWNLYGNRLAGSYLAKALPAYMLPDGR
ncbi:MAG: hypothetical protein ABS46_03460 [Cytophagaceae bacterium SCN 52-12]|nr:MAG: hypothetical protein ABS46_03460 [Cytophagaceae bacterium SCN 52-12]